MNSRIHRRLGFVLLLCCALSVLLNPASARAGTSDTKGVWTGSPALGLVAGEINGKIEMICLPRLEFIGAVDHNQLVGRIGGDIKRQNAVFHLYSTDLGKPRRQNGLLFATDVYLMDAKMTYSGLLRSWGFKFKISKKPPFEEPDYMREVESGAFVAHTTHQAKNAKPPAQGQPGSPGGTPVLPPKPGAFSPAPSMPTGGDTAIQGAFDVLPAGVLPASVRKTKEEMNARLKALKNKPYQAEVPRVDIVRWAGGKMGTIAADGKITDAPCEGQKLTLKIVAPTDAAWLTPERTQKLAGQSCEYIFRRDEQGREALKDGAYQLSDIYFTDLGTTWGEWAVAEGLVLASSTAEPGFASGPVTLKIRVCEGTWKKLMTPAIGLITFAKPLPGLKNEEYVRLPPLDFGKDTFADAAKRIDAQLTGKPVSVSLMVSPDDQPYTELGQKRAARIWLPALNTSLPLLAKPK